MAGTVNLQVRLKRRPKHMPVAEDFEVATCDLPSLAEGQLLCRTHYLSLDLNIQDALFHHLKPGQLLPGETVNEIVLSKHPDFSAGDLVTAYAGWQRFAVSNGQNVRKIEHAVAHPPLALGILGLPGLSAYAGLLDLSQPKAGEDLVVTAAAGPIGSIAGQIGKIKGCRVTGIAGDRRECEWLSQEAGFDQVINYREEDVGGRLAESCPDGIDIFFDNVGGKLLHHAMEHLAVGARVILCGLRNGKDQSSGPDAARIIKTRATVRGMLVTDHLNRFPEFIRNCIRWINEGRIQYKEEIIEGLERAPDAFAQLVAGHNFGKMVVKVI